MAKYKVRHNQNLLDVALYLYGSIEGVFDLLITNTWLEVDTDLQPGMVLEYHDEFVINPAITARYGDGVPFPANGERKVYYKGQPAPQFGLVIADDDQESLSFSVAGKGEIYIDWGDNSPLERVILSSVIRQCRHNMDSEVDERRIKLYAHATVRFTTLDFSEMKGQLLLTRSVVCDRFYMKDNALRLDFMPLLLDTYYVDLGWSDIHDLMPLRDLSLQTLNLRNARISSGALEEYLEYVASAEGHGTRRACTVTMDRDMVTDRVRAAMDSILGEEEWNTPQPWKFLISGQEYSPSN